MLARIRDTYNQIAALPQIALIGANMVTLFGVWFFGWDVVMILAVYWAETGVIGLYTILKIIKAEDIPVVYGGDAQKSQPKIFLIPFFIIHFGLFMFAHALFLIGLFSDADVLMQISYMGLLLALVFLLVSHGISYWYNYLQAGEYKRLSGQDLVQQPYKRVIVMHFVIILSSYLLTRLQSEFEMTALMLLIFMKIAFDLRAHQNEHV